MKLTSYGGEVFEIAVGIGKDYAVLVKDLFRLFRWCLKAKQCRLERSTGVRPDQPRLSEGSERAYRFFDGQAVGVRHKARLIQRRAEVGNVTLCDVRALRQ